VIASAADGLMATAIAERLRRSIASVVIEGVEQGITVSAGVTQLVPSDATGGDLVRRADLALYGAKAAGRNRVHTLFLDGGSVRHPQRVDARILEFPVAG